MTHEFKKIVRGYEEAAANGSKAVLATVVALDGSSYRRPGVRMLILDDRRMIGAVSGGCVEKEVLRQAEPVFNTGTPKMMTYDGRYRLGCEGILYILLEPFHPKNDFLKTFWEVLESRESFSIRSCFDKHDGESEEFGSFFVYGDKALSLRETASVPDNLSVFEEAMSPCFKLLIVGAEHDAVQLCTFAALTGWEVAVVAPPSEEKSLVDFPGAGELIQTMPESLDTGRIDTQTAVMLMTHSYVKDLQYLLALKDTRPAYLGLLGPSGRREKLLNEFLEHCPEVSEQFFEGIHGPAGINIGAETPQEIAIAVLAEILSVIRRQDPIPLKNKKGAIHS